MTLGSLEKGTPAKATVRLVLDLENIDAFVSTLSTITSNDPPLDCVRREAVGTSVSGQRAVSDIRCTSVGSECPQGKLRPVRLGHSALFRPTLELISDLDGLF